MLKKSRFSRTAILASMSLLVLSLQLTLFSAPAEASSARDGLLIDARGNVIIPPITKVINPGLAKMALANAQWQLRAPFTTTARGQHAVVAHPNGRIYLFGGWTGTANLSTMEVYDIGTNSWSSAAAMPVADRGTGAAVDDSGYIYFFGGIQNNSYRYNPGTNTWSSIPASPTPGVWEAAAAKGGDGRIYLFGGEGSSAVPTNAVQIYNPATSTWSTGAGMPTARYHLGAVKVNDSLIYTFGGCTSGSLPAVGVVEIYNIRANTWSTGASMPMPRGQFGVTLGADGKVYTIGGKTSYYNNYAPFFDTVEVYDPRTNTWMPDTSLPTALGELEAVTAGNTIFAIGGTSGTYTNLNYALQVIPIDTPNVAHISAAPRGFRLGPSDPTVQTLTICNTGIRDTLQYSIDPVAGGRIVADTASGRLASGACRNVQLTFNRSGLPLGSTVVNLVVRHNAWLDTNPVSVPCTLLVDSAEVPHITLSPGFFKVGPNYPTVDMLTICNTGTRDTLQYTIDPVTGGRIVADTATGRLAAGACRNVQLTFNRTGLLPGNNIVQLVVRHNGPIEPNPLSVPCTLVVDSNSVPHIALTPGNFRIEPTDTNVQTLRICNPGTQDSLRYSLNLGAGNILINEVCNSVDYIELLNIDATDVTIGGWRLTWTDDAGSAFYSYTIPAGTTIRSHRCVQFLETGTSNDSVIYMNGGNIGWVTTSQLSVSLLNSFGVGVDFFKTSGDAALPPAGTTWSGTGVTAGYGTYYRSSTNDNNTAADWVGSSSYTPCLINPGQTSFPSGGGIITADTVTGSVAAGQCRNVSLTFNRSGLLPGNTVFQFTVSHNSPLSPDPISVPCTLVVDSASVPRITLSPGFFKVGPNYPTVDTLTICNTSTQDTLQYTIDSVAGRRVVVDTSSGRLAAGACRNVQLTFNRTGLLPGNTIVQLVVRHNGPLEPNPLSVPCTLYVDSNSVPRITLSPGGFRKGPTDPTVDTLTICNPGTHDTLQYTIDSVAGRRVVVDTSSGRLAAGACRNVTLTFNRSGLPFGNTIVQLVVRHNGPLEPNPLSVPCTLYVDSASVAHIALNPGSFMIGPTDTTVRTLQICNTSVLDTLHYTIAKNGSNPNILAWTYGAELTYRYPNTITAIRQRIPSANIATTATAVAATLSALLQNADIFLIPAQYSSTPSAAVGTAFRPVLDSFVRRGGIVIVQQPYWESAFLTASGLDSLTYSNYTYSTTATVNVPSDPVFDSISAATFAMPYYTGYWTGRPSAVRLASYSTYAVGTKQLRGSGAIYLLGADFYNSDATWTRIIDNCIIQNFSTGLVTADTATGSVAAGGCRNVQLTFNRSGLLPGTKVFKLRVRHDSPLSPDPLSVQCTLVVDSTTMTYQALSMAVTIYTGDTAMRYVTMQNTGSSRLIDSVIKISNDGVILINEASNEPDYIELLNTGSTDMNIGGYRIVWSLNSAASASYTIPAGTIIRAHRCVLFNEGTGTGSDSVIFMGNTIDWIQSSQLSVSLLNSTGTGVDFFKTSSDTTTPPAGTSWSGSGFVISASAYYYYRLTTADNNNAADWGQGSALTVSTTSCRLNPGQIFSGAATGYITAIQDSFHIDAGQSSLIRFKYDATTLVTGGFFIDTFHIIQNSKNVASPITVICSLTVISNIVELIPYTPDPTINRQPTLQWHPVTSASLYTLEASLTPAFSTLVTTQQTIDTAFTPAAEFPLGMLYWRVRCDLNTRYSLQDNFYIQNDSIPLLIPIVPDTIGEKPSTLFTWHPSTGATTYRITVYDIDSTVPVTMLLTYVTDTFYLHGLTLPTSKYTWTVSANFDYTRTAYPDTFWVNSSPVFPRGNQLILPSVYALKVRAADGLLKISCAIPRLTAGGSSMGAAVTIDMFDIRGKLVRVLFNGILPAGYHQLPVMVSNVATGVYYCRMRAGGMQKIAAVHLMR